MLFDYVIEPIDFTPTNERRPVYTESCSLKTLMATANINGYNSV